MITEELNIRITADTKGVESSVSKVKNTIKSIGGKETTNATKSVSASMDEVKESIDKLRNLTALEFLTDNLEKLSTLGSHLNGTFKDLSEDIKIMFSDLIPASYEKGEWKGWKRSFKDFGKDFKAVGKGLKMNLKQIGGDFKALFTGIIPAGALVAVAAILGVVAVIAALVASVKNAINVAKQLKEIVSEAKKLNMTVKGYQEWVYVLDQVGVGADKLSDFLKTLADEQLAVREGTEDMTAAFGKLGLSAEDVVTMGQEELFNETVTRLQQMESVTERTALAYKIFGEDAAQLNAVLQLTNEETRALTSNFALLGGAASDSLIKKSTILTSSIANLKQAWQGLKNTLAEALMPTINAIVRGLTKVIAVVNMFLRTIFGFELIPSSSIGAATGGVDSYSKSVKGATAAVEKLKRTTMGFDELNIVQNPNSSSGGSDAGTGSGGGGFGGGDYSGAIPDVDTLGLGKIREWFDKYRTTIQDIATWSMIGIGVVGCVLCLMSGNILGAIAFGSMAGIGIAMGNSNGAFERLGNTLKGWWNNIKEWFVTNVKPIFTKEYWQQKFEPIFTSAQEKLEATRQAISEKWNAVKEWFNTNVKPIFTKAYWQKKFEPIRAAATEKIDATKAAISDKWNVVRDWFNTNVAPKFTKTYWNNKFDNIRSAVSDKMSAAKDAFTNGWSNVKAWFNTNVKPKFTAAYWKEKFNTIGDGARAAFNGVISIVERAINGIISKINTLSWQIPDWVPVYGGDRFGFNFNPVYIPRLATGGIVTRSTLANIGENGREAVLPLENNLGWMDLLADKIAARSSGPSKLVLNVDGRELGWVTIDNINKITEQTGGLQLRV